MMFFSLCFINFRIIGIMQKKTLSKRTQQNTSPSSGLNFVYQSYNFLCQCIDILNKLNDKGILNDFKQMDTYDFRCLKDQNMNIKKLFHIDLKNNFIYWQVLKKSKRTVLKKSFDSRETLYEWQFTQNGFGSIQAIQVMGKWKYLELKKNNAQSQEILRTINLNTVNNSFVNFEEFYQSIIDMMNIKLIEAYNGRIMKNFVSNTNQNEMHEQLWEFVSIEITKIWKKFQEQIKVKQIQKLYNQSLFKDISKLFNTNSQFKCHQGQSFVPKRSKPKKDVNFIYNSNKNINQQVFTSFKKDISFYTLETNLQFDPQDSNSHTNFIDKSLFKYPHPQNYPLIDNYVSQEYQDKRTQNICRKSLKRPANSCHQNCQCLYQDGQKCPNLERKIQCEHHDCLNSRIRQKKGIHCWYLDQQKNQSNIQNLKQKLTSGLQIKEFHSFGLDFHTATLLYYLLPFNRIQDGQIIDNQKEKKELVQTIIPYQVSKVQNLYLAVKKIVSERQYQKYFYEAKILQKKLKWIKKMEIQNLKDKLNNQQPTYPNVQEPKCFYKGLGVINFGLKLPKNTLIGEFVGETMSRYRIQEKQQICAKLIKMKNPIQFYCIDVFTHLDQKCEPRFFSVDPQNKGNFCRNLNHSCDPNCKVDVIVSSGKYILGVYTIREVQQNEQLTFDYMSVTDDYQEYIKSVCLCSSLTCRGRYFRYQDQIYTDLNGEFLEKEESIRKRIKKLIRSSKNRSRFSTSLNNKYEFLKSKQVNISYVPEKSKFWFLDWIETNQKIIANQLLYLHNKKFNSSQSKLRYSICQESKVYDPKLGEKEKIATLNAKIQKISYYLNKVNDFNPPFTCKSHDFLIKKLQYQLSSSKISQKINYNTSQKYQDLNLFERKIWDLRFNLFEAGSFELIVNKNIDKAFFYFQQAFTFIYIQIHKYPDYKSEPINIWRENLSKYQDRVQYFGKDLYILQNLILWAGEIKKIQIKSNKSQIFNNEISKQNLTHDLLNQNHSFEIDGDFKKVFLKKEFLLAVFQIQEQKFRLKLPQQIKEKSMFSLNTDLKILKIILEKWVEKQFTFFKSTKEKFKSSSNKLKKMPILQNGVKIEPPSNQVEEICQTKIIQKSQNKKKSTRKKKIKQQVKIEA